MHRPPDGTLRAILRAVEAALEAADETLRVTAQLGLTDWDLVAVTEVARAVQEGRRKAHYAARLASSADGHGTDLPITRVGRDAAGLRSAPPFPLPHK